MIAVKNKRQDLVELLLKHGADTLIHNAQGLNSLEIAKNDKNSDQNIVNLLEQAIANDPTRKVIVGITEANYPRIGTLQPQLMTAAWYARWLKGDVNLLKRGLVDEEHRTILSEIKERLPSTISELKQLMDDDNIKLNAAQKAHLQQAITYAESFLANQ